MRDQRRVIAETDILFASNLAPGDQVRQGIDADVIGIGETYPAADRAPLSPSTPSRFANWANTRHI